MNLSITTTDNITEILDKIIKFTERRDKLLNRNIKNVDVSGYIPKDLDIEVFAKLMSYAISEHIRNDRLVLQDTENIRFGQCGNFESLPMVDEYAMHLLSTDRSGYMEFQIQKLSENMINNSVAVELLEHKHGERASLSG